MNNLQIRNMCADIVTECGDDVKLGDDGYFDIYGASEKVKKVAVKAYVKQEYDSILAELECLLDADMPAYLQGLWADQSVDSQISESRELDNYDG